VSLPVEGGGIRADAARIKTILLPGGDRALKSFIASESPVPVEVVSNPAAPLCEYDLAILVVESVEPALRAAVTRVLTDDVSYVVLVRRDVWSAASNAMRKLLDEVQRDPRRKLIRFWRDRADLERTLCDDVFTLDDETLVSQSLRDGAFVDVGSTFEQTWTIENTGFCVWEGRTLRELASEHLVPEQSVVPIPRTEPGEQVSVTVRFAAPDEPLSCRSVWQIVAADGRLVFPWAPGLRCQVLAVY
jgi:hypothetical protein